MIFKQFLFSKENSQTLSVSELQNHGIWYQVAIIIQFASKSELFTVGNKNIQLWVSKNTVQKY